MSVPVILITGPVGVGKTSVAYVVGEELGSREVPHAVVDFDAICSCYPWTDRFNATIGCKNLAAIWTNYAALGIDRLVISGVIEDRSELAGYVEAVPGAEVTIVRLRASDETLRARVGGRDHGDRQAWHAARAIELARQMDRDALEDLVVETDGRLLPDIAREVLVRTGWTS